MLRRKEDLGVRPIEIFLAKYYICEQKHIQLQHRELVTSAYNHWLPSPKVPEDTAKRFGTNPDQPQSTRSMCTHNQTTTRGKEMSKY